MGRHGRSSLSGCQRAAPLGWSRASFAEAQMLHWLFRPSCPCDPAAKAWVEERLEWLAGEFDDSAFSGRRVVLPTPEFFPDPYDGSKKAVRKLLDRVCEYMDVVPDLVALKFVADAGK